jgi:hypothetical protein
MHYKAPSLCIVTKLTSVKPRVTHKTNIKIKQLSIIMSQARDFIFLRFGFED